MIDNITYLLYSHDSYKDILDIHLKQFDKYNSNINIIIGFNNKQYINDIYKDKYKVIEYDDNIPYMERLYYLLNSISSQYVLLMHDINIPIDFPKENIIENTISFMYNNNIDQVRMFVSGIYNPVFDDTIFHKIPDNSYYFSINSAKWNRNSLLSVGYIFKSHIYRCSECHEIQNYVKSMNNYYVSSINDIKLNGHNHVISYYFPFCHVMSHGKWAINPYCEQSQYIYSLLHLYNIDINSRGTN